MSDPTQTPTHYAEAFASWHTDRPLPEAVNPRLILELKSLRGLSLVRRQVRDFLLSSLDVAREEEPTPAVEDTVDQAILVIDELTSNAIRHAVPPSSLHIGDEEQHWLVVVIDSAPQLRPTPARERPAGQGGYGLYVIADLTTAHGVHYQPDHKLVWARIKKRS